MTAEGTGEEKPYWHCFWPLSPPPADHREVKLLESMKMLSKHGWDWHIALLGRGKVIDVLGVSVPADFMRTGQPYLELVGGALSRIFAAVSLVYSSEAKLLSLGDENVLSVGMYSDHELPLAYPLEITLPQRELPNWDVHSLLTFAAHEELPADAVSALSEALRLDIPRHYRLLSLCRALELLIPNDRERSQWLDAYEDEFRALNVDLKRFRNYLPQLRNRCAHGQVSREPPIFGIVSGGVPIEVFDLIMKAVIAKLNETSGLQIVPPTRAVVGESSRFNPVEPLPS